MSQFISKKLVYNRLRLSPLLVSFIAVLLVFYDFGYNQDDKTALFLNYFYTSTLLVGIISTIARYLKKTEKPPLKALFFDIFSLLLFTIIIIDDLSIFPWFKFLNSNAWNYGALFLVFIREFSALKLNLKKTYLNPAQIFILSFLAIIVFGAFLLKLPNATNEEIGFIDALFTSTSAVCVTGLVVVDTGTYFTFFGQCIILVLIQLGGIGIMTFASFFSYFFRGGSSYESTVMIGDLTSSDKIGEVFSTLKNIIIITFIIEALGAIIIFSSLSSEVIATFSDRSFFSIFHSVSAFCNAGFSTLSESLFASDFRFNYSLQSIIMVLFIFGGLGFPIVFNLFNYIKYLIIKRLIPYLFNLRRDNIVQPWVVNLSSRITLITTFTLLVIGGMVFYFFEYENSLAEHSPFGKVITALFGAATPRTAGFNTVDISSLRLSTLMLVLLLMWVGASPASTGGGIKTSTFAIATLNFWSLARGKNRIEIFRREIADISVRRSFAIISLSLVVIGTATFLISYLDAEKDMLGIAFECFSAYSTVGLSVGITSQLSTSSKFIIIAVMFIGRVSMLSILIALVNKEKYKNYRYSKEEILIN
ncbi:MAG: potassium transporter TrkG [Vicingaceae bacterium]